MQPVTTARRENAKLALLVFFLIWALGTCLADPTAPPTRSHQTIDPTAALLAGVLP